jgi:hypothetical protein
LKEKGRKSILEKIMSIYKCQETKGLHVKGQKVDNFILQDLNVMEKTWPEMVLERKIQARLCQTLNL